MTDQEREVLIKRAAVLLQQGHTEKSATKALVDEGYEAGISEAVVLIVKARMSGDTGGARRAANKQAYGTAFKNLGLGALIGGVGTAITVASEGQAIFYGAIAVGGIYFILGLIQLIITAASS